MTVTLRTAAQDRIPGVRTFYLSSLSVPDVEYTIKVIRTKRKRTITCTCPDDVHRAFPLGRSCKHIRIVRALIAAAHGVSRIPKGETATFQAFAFQAFEVRRV